MNLILFNAGAQGEIMLPEHILFTIPNRKSQI